MPFIAVPSKKDLETRQTDLEGTGTPAVREWKRIQEKTYDWRETFAQKRTVRKQQDHTTERGHVSMTRDNLVRNPVPARLSFFF